MAKGKKDEVLRARVEEDLKKKFARFCKNKRWSEAHTMREAITEYLNKHAEAH